jgi:predicted nucleic acid-binding protein
MAALDTNVVIRLLIGDDPAQTRVAESLLASEHCSISPTVLLECEWVLRACYGLAPPTIAAAFADLLALEPITPLDPVLTQIALDGYRRGLDFADALHAAQRHDGAQFVTFDRSLAKRAPKAGVLGVRLLPG